jgi:hypothetical protein
LNTGASAGAGTINITDGAKLAASAAITVSNTLNVNSQFIVGVSTGNLTLGAITTPLAFCHGPVPMRSRAFTPASTPGIVVLR